MSDGGTAEGKKRSLLSQVVGILAIIALVGGAAIYQEQIAYFFRLQLWDKSASGRTVQEFLKAGKAGQQEQADRFLGSTTFKPLIRGGKWVGYSYVTPGGDQNFIFDELVPADGPTITNTKFVYGARAVAEVTAPNRNDKPVTYELERREDGWKIMLMYRSG